MTSLNHAATCLLLGTRTLLLAGPAQATGPGPAPHPAHRAAVACPAAIAKPKPLAEPAAAPLTIVLAGTILGADGRPRPGACVFPITNSRLIAVTDATGTFHLQVPAAAGPLRLQAEYVGLGSSRVEVDGQHPQPVRIVLGE